MNKIESIDFVLINSEVIRVPIENILQFKINKVEKNNVALDLFCVIKNNENIKNITEWAYYQYNPIRRLYSYRDISEIYINFKDRAASHLYVKKWGCNPYVNIGQECIVYNGKTEVKIKNPYDR